MTRGNTTFCGGEPTWANACVGNNGDPGYWDYAKGFSQAANLLIDEVLNGKGFTYAFDELIYPVCFNMRHSVELRLKGAISVLVLLEKFRGRVFEFDLEGSHDIGNIWRFFIEKSRSVDDRYNEIVDRLNAKILDIAEIDVTGQTFRYPINRESQKHLVDVAIINFYNLKESFSEIEDALDDLHRLNKYLYDEYWYGTFTKRLSRKNIFYIAAQLPTRDQWGKESFVRTKSEIKEMFNIGSKELSESIKIIQGNFETAPIVGISVPLLGVSETILIDFIKHWLKRHNNNSDTAPIGLGSSIWGSEDMLESISRDAEVQNEVWENVNSFLTPQIMAGILALFHFARELDFSEHYIHIYACALQEVEWAFKRPGSDAREQFMYVFNKTNAVDSILKSLYFLKQGEVAEMLVSTHGLEKRFPWLDEARSGGLFRKPEYYGYAK
ncbi:hypothetical protein [Modicisalibacter xianhensis]|uniref:Uncharacterized protein n=1 Tax=Modicisalibacter xianhensis TaxID=442341 RepID=A0A1I3GPP5_9GAMM|nr:hypothetical protein [Halomonas xianhensis]SFI25465.1 hypothetical protein SAMN04487959_1381 [Halomonas xianhensis]